VTRIQEEEEIRRRVEELQECLEELERQVEIKDGELSELGEAN